MNYYKKLDKQEQRKIKQQFFISDECKIYKKANTIIFLSIIGIIVALGSVVFDYLYKTGVINYVLDGLLFIFSLSFLVKMNSMKASEINKFALANKSVQKKTKAKNVSAKNEKSAKKKDAK